MAAMENNLLKLRAARGLSLQKLADMTGYSAQYLNKLETGKENKRLNTDLITVLCKALKCTVTELLGDGAPPIMDFALFQACAKALDRGLAFMKIQNVTHEQYALVAARAYVVGVERGYTLPDIDQSFIQKTLEEVREIA